MPKLTGCVELNLPSDLFNLVRGDVLTKGCLYRLIIDSKKNSSSAWEGYGFQIRNTPQQGINWIGDFPSLKGVIVKTKSGAYHADKEVDSDNYHYSFKAITKADGSTVINRTEKANLSLINQPKFHYPVLLFAEDPCGWKFKGKYRVEKIKKEYVVLKRDAHAVLTMKKAVGKVFGIEGKRIKRAHSKIERCSAVVAAVKQNRDRVCDICKMDFKAMYGVEYIEAHHVIQLAALADEHVIYEDDFVLLCPNCHRAVHIYMRRFGYCYKEIVGLLVSAI